MKLEARIANLVGNRNVLFCARKIRAFVFLLSLGAFAVGFSQSPAGIGNPTSYSKPVPKATWPNDLQTKERNLELGLEAAQRKHDVKNTGVYMLNLSAVFMEAGDWNGGLYYAILARAVFKQIGDSLDEARAWNNAGASVRNLGNTQEALIDLNHALSIERTMTDQPGLRSQAQTLVNLGGLYAIVSDYDKAVDCLKQSIALSEAVGDRLTAAQGLGLVGGLYVSKLDLQNAITSFNGELQAGRELHDGRREAHALIGLGAVQAEFGKDEEAKGIYESALSVVRTTGNAAEEARALAALAVIDEHEGDYQAAQQRINQASQIYRGLGSKGLLAYSLETLGFIDVAVGNRAKAIDDFNEALSISQSVKSRGLQATILAGLGVAYTGTDNARALQYYNQALPLAKATKNPFLEAGILTRLSDLNRTSVPALSVFYGKQAVQLVEEVRKKISSYDQETQTTFLSRNDGAGMKLTDYYHHLAAVLTDQGRLPEAQQILDLLKEQEYASYVASGAVGTSSKASSEGDNSVSRTKAEEEGARDYERSTARLVALGEEWSALNRLPSRAPAQEERYQRLSDQMLESSRELNAYYARLYDLFGKSNVANKQVAELKGNVARLQQQLSKMPHTVALYTNITEDRCSIIVITGSASVAREYAINRKELEARIREFALALRDRNSDARSAGQTLYKILVEPIQAYLDQAHAETLVWVLDGKLRYLPVAALYDGHRYLVQRYQSVSILPVSISRISEKPDMAHLSVSGMGITAGYDGLAELPGVKKELDGVVRDPLIKEARGALPGSVLLNEQFTEKAMEGQLSSSHAVVHIASHFVLRDGDESRSYLLLAGKEDSARGYRLTLSEFRDNPRLGLDKTELLTLSACETGLFANSSDGREIDGLATTAQLRGAKSVLSSLWNVNDESTARLMIDFYQIWVRGQGNVGKGEALRQAQLHLLQEKGFSSPYYWAPFVLAGNWQ